MRLQTNIEFSVSGGSPTSIPKAFKAIRRISPQLTLGDFQQKLSNGSVVANAVTYRNEISEYLENLNVLVDALKEFGKHVSSLVLTDPASRAISVDDLEETLVFHRSYQPSDLRSELADYLRTFEEADWLANTGKPLSDSGVTNVDIPPKGDSNWVYLQVAMQNGLTNLLVDEKGYHHGCLQVYYDQLMPFIANLTQSKLASVPSAVFDERNEPSGLIMLACIEKYFAELIPNGDAVAWAQWLTRGRVPCGWSGQYPDGQLVVW